MANKSYGLLCPISRACEILEPRWTIQILTELWSGSTRFNDIHRGVGRISRGLLSKRLKELERLGLIERVEDKAANTVDYIRTKKGTDLEPALNALAAWAQCNIDAELALCDSSLSTLMWGMRNAFVVSELPKKRVVIRFHFSDEDAEYNTYWSVIEPGKEVEMCVYDPGLDVNLYVETTVMSLGGVIMGRTNLEREIDSGALFLSGDARLVRTIDRWLKLSEYAKLDGIALLPKETQPTNKHDGKIATC